VVDTYRTMMRALRDGDFQAFSMCIDDDIRYEAYGEWLPDTHSLTGVDAYVMQVQSVMRELRLGGRVVSATDTTVVVEFTAVNQEGAIAFTGRGVAILEFRDGKLVSEVEYFAKGK
jgi:ketosteroid isomerase-like protein